ncbi:MAG: hypothetical protein AB1486_12710 [Planctomycetota bacterium]
MSSAQPLPDFGPCPGRAGPIERLVHEGIGPGGHEALVAHIRSCERCQTYLHWIRAYDSLAARLIVTQRWARNAERTKELMSRRLREAHHAELANWLVRLAERHMLSRKDPDHGLFLSTNPAAAQLVRERIEKALDRTLAAPWIALEFERCPEVLQLREIISPRAVVDSRASARMCLDLAVSLDPRCYRGLELTGYLIREGGYKEIQLLEACWEAMLSANDPRVRAEALAQRAVWLGVCTGDLDSATALTTEAYELDPRRLDAPFNAWFFCNVAGSPKTGARYLRSLRATMRHVEPPRWLLSRAAKSYRAALQEAARDGFLPAATYRRCSRNLENLLTGFLLC